MSKESIFCRIICQHLTCVPQIRSCWSHYFVTKRCCVHVTYKICNNQTNQCQCKFVNMQTQIRGPNCPQQGPSVIFVSISYAKLLSHSQTNIKTDFCLPLHVFFSLFTQLLCQSYDLGRARWPYANELEYIALNWCYGYSDVTVLTSHKLIWACPTSSSLVTTTLAVISD